MELESVCIALDELSKDTSIPKNVRTVLCSIKTSLECPKEQILIRIDAALQKIEEIAMDSNLDSSGRTELWELTSTLETFKKL